MKAVALLAFLAIHQLLHGAEYTGFDRWRSQNIAWYFAEFNLPPLIDARPATDQFAIRIVHFNIRNEPEPRFRDKEVAVSIRGAAGGPAEIMTHHFHPKSEWKKFALSKENWNELVRLVFSEEFLSAPVPQPYLTGPTLIIEAASASSYRLMYVMSPDDFPTKRQVTPIMRRVLDRLMELGGVLPSEIVWGPKNEG